MSLLFFFWQFLILITGSWVGIQSSWAETTCFWGRWRWTLYLGSWESSRTKAFSIFEGMIGCFKFHQANNLFITLEGILAMQHGIDLSSFFFSTKLCGCKGMVQWKWFLPTHNVVLVILHLLLCDLTLLPWLSSKNWFFRMDLLFLKVGNFIIKLDIFLVVCVPCIDSLLIACCLEHWSRSWFFMLLFGGVRF